MNRYIGIIRNNIGKKYNSFPKQVKASFWFLICSFMQKGISVLTTPIFTRLLDTAEYGKFNIFNSWLNGIQIIVTLNLTAGVYTQGLVKLDKERSVFSSSIQGLTLTLCSAWFLIYICFQSFWNNLFSLTTFQMICMFIMIWASSVFNLWAAEQRVGLNYRNLVIVTIIVSILKPLVGIIFVTHASDKVNARIAGLVLVEIVAYIRFFFTHLSKGKTFFSKKYWRYALTFNIPLVPHFLSQSILNSADRIMIERMVGASEAGIYSLAYSLSFLMTLFNTALLQTINPWIFQKIKTKKTSSVNSIAIICLAGIAVVNLLLIYFAPEIVYIFAPSSYRDAIWVIPPVTMSVYFIFMSYFFVDFELYYERTDFVTTATIASAVVNIALNYIFIRLYGFCAAGYTTLACYILYAIGHYYFMKKLCKSWMDTNNVYDMKSFFVISIIFVFIGFLGLCSYSYPILRYCILGTIIAISIFNRKKIIKQVKTIIELRKNN